MKDLGGNVAHTMRVRYTQDMTTTRNAEQAIRTAYATFNREIVGLRELRAALKGFTRNEIDIALDDMIILEDVRIFSEANRKALSQADRDAAVVIGDALKHCIAIY